MLPFVLHWWLYRTQTKRLSGNNYMKINSSFTCRLLCNFKNPSHSTGLSQFLRRWHLQTKMSCNTALQSGHLLVGGEPRSKICIWLWLLQNMSQKFPQRQRYLRPRLSTQEEGRRRRVCCLRRTVSVSKDMQGRRHCPRWKH